MVGEAPLKGNRFFYFVKGETSPVHQVQLSRHSVGYLDMTVTLLLGSHASNLEVKITVIDF